MTRASPMREALWKETRALLPIWLSAAAVIGAAAVAGAPDLVLRSARPSAPDIYTVVLPMAGWLAFALGSVALGAFSIGHEYTHRTLSALLVQPRPRRALLATKAGVLVVHLAALTLLAAAMWLPSTQVRLPLLVLTPVIGLTLAPWLTMACRNVMAGVVFSLTVPAFFWVTSDVISVVVRLAADDASRVSEMILWSGTLVAGTVALVAAPRQFLRLEAIDAPRHLSLRWMPGLQRSARGAERVRRRWPRLHLLIAKELRLQSVTLLLSGVYVAGWGLVAVTHLDEFVLGSAFLGITILYAVVTATLIGAVASAEERAHGTLASELLQPIAVSTQWVVKLATVLGLVIALTMVLPAVLEHLHPLNDQRTFSWTLAGGLLLFTAVGLYSSSLCHSGLSAVLLSSLVAAGLWLLFAGGSSLGAGAALAVAPVEFHRLSGSLLESLTEADVRLLGLYWRLPESVGCGLALLMLWISFGNHRSAEGGRARWRQQLSLPVVALVGGALVGASPPLLYWYLATH